MDLKEIPAENIIRPLNRNEVISLIISLTAFGAVTYFTINWIVDAIDPTRIQKLRHKNRYAIKFTLFLCSCGSVVEHCV